jgi:hypothetical protein
MQFLAGLAPILHVLRSRNKTMMPGTRAIAYGIVGTLKRHRFVSRGPKGRVWAITSP